MFWPARLAAFYPHPNDQLPFWQVLLSIAFLISVSLLAILSRKKRPYIFTGWFWYVGMLVPVIGLLQAGEQARADRYTYLPQIGLYVLITWGITDLMALLMMRSSGSRLSQPACSQLLMDHAESRPAVHRAGATSYSAPLSRQLSSLR